MAKVCLIFAIVFGGIARIPAAEPAPSSKENADKPRIIAIDVLLLPDATMVAKAKAVNAQLRANYPQGYTLNSEQMPHITLVQCYVRQGDLPAIEAAVGRVVNKQQVTAWPLEAIGYNYGIWAGVAITSISIQRTPDLDRLETDVVRAVEPFTVKGGTKAAFSTTRELPKIDRDIVDYVENFTSKSTGANYRPHVTVGVAHESFVKELKSKRFDNFTFKPAGIAIYQLGNFGTAQKKLWEWKPE